MLTHLSLFSGIGGLLNEEKIEAEYPLVKRRET